MNRICIALVAGLFPSLTLAEPLVTISCHEPKGFNMQYGVPFSDLMQAKTEKKPEPKSQLRGPTPDGYVMKPTFIVDSNRKKLTVVWAESASDTQLREETKKFNLPEPSAPPPAQEVDVVMFMPDQISAIQLTPPNNVTVYSFFPKFGSAFISSQYYELGGKNTRQMSVFSACEFSWSNGQ